MHNETQQNFKIKWETQIDLMSRHIKLLNPDTVNMRAKT